tara:strand:+ start:62 stop:1129 length:1068 start_codon:yes stop_codon:yes gene_type:complete
MEFLNNEWDEFMNNTNTNTPVKRVFPDDSFKPTFTDLYISTQTKIGYLDKHIPLEEIFWKLPIIDYNSPQEGILKKIIKINSKTPEEVVILEENINNQKNCSHDVLLQINSLTGKTTKFKDIRKITAGVSKKDLINFRKKKKSAFYNCFAVIIRIKYKNKFTEINIKLFNTGKLEIPGIQNIETLNIAVDILLEIIKKTSGYEYKYLEDKVETVLINSNFSCNFYIIRNKLHNILKYKYNIHSCFDPCSYPGIQCKFFYNEKNLVHKGICKCKQKCTLNKKNKKNNNCKVISFMIFRTGSILIVGNCDENILDIIYKFIIDLFNKELFNEIISKKNETIKKKKKKYRKRIVTFTN